MTLSNALETLHRRLAQRWSEIPASAKDLTWNEYRYLRAVQLTQGYCRNGPKGAPPASPHSTDLAVELGIKRPSASAMLRKLERRGLVNRLDCRSDARAQHVFLSKAGAAALKDGAALYARSARALAGRLSGREAKMLQKLLEKACGGL